MPNYKEMYLTLFREITSAIEQMNACDVLAAKETLIKAQQNTEELYIERDGSKQLPSLVYQQPQSRTGRRRRHGSARLRRRAAPWRRPKKLEAVY